MELIAALCLATVLWVAALLGQPQPSTILAERLYPLLGPVFAGAVAGSCIAAAGIVVVGGLAVGAEAVFADLLPDDAARRFVLLPIRRRGAEAYAVAAVAVPAVVAVRLLAAPSEIAGELIVLALLFMLAGAQALRPRSYRHEIVPGLLSFPRRLAALVHRMTAVPDAPTAIERETPPLPPAAVASPFEPGAYEACPDAASNTPR